MKAKQSITVLLGMSLAALSTVAASQETPGAGAATTGKSVKEEFIVTARKREENLQEVPIALDVLDSSTIEKLNIRDIADVSKYSPSVIFDQGYAAQDTRITIRGLAPTRGRQNVAVLIDGIDVTGQAVQTSGGSLLTNTRLFDVERIEVLKGPQNALYGRTAFAGAINYITKEPSKDGLDAQIYADGGNNGRYDGRLSVSGPLIAGTLYGGVNLAAWTDDGHYKNSVTGGDVGGRDGTGISGNLSWDITDRFNAKLRAEYTDEDIDQSPYTSISPTTPVAIPASAFNTVPAGGSTPVLSPDAPASINSVTGKLPDGDSLSVTLSENPRTLTDYEGTKREITRASLILDYDFGPVTLLSLTGLTDSDIFSIEDGRREGSMLGSSVAQEFWVEDETKQISQELRLQSNGDGAISWTVGALYWAEDVDFTDGSVNCLNEPAPFNADCAPSIAASNGAARFADPWVRESKHWSVYGLINWSITDQLTLSLEGRYVDEEMEVTGPDRSGIFGVRPPLPRGIIPLFGSAAMQPRYGDLTDKVTDDFFAPKATLSWMPSDTRMYYASVAQAYKPAGISIVANLMGYNPDASRFEQEELIAYEIGTKTSWIDNQLTLNAALFYQDFSDKQVGTQQIINGALALVPVNASSADIYGLELESNWQATENLDLYASYTYLDTEYQDFNKNSSGAGSIARAGNCTPEFNGFTSTCNLNLSGNELEFVPKHSLLAGLEYRHNITDDLAGFLGGDYIFQDERYLDPENTVLLDSYNTVDFRAGLSTDSWDVILYVTNAFEDDAIKSSLANTENGELAVYGPPFGANPPTTQWMPFNQTPILPNKREYGLRLMYRFGG